MAEEEIGIDLQTQNPPKLNWQELSKNQNNERVQIDGVSRIDHDTKQRVDETLSEALAIAGLTDQQYRLTLKIVPEQFLYHGAKVTGWNEIEINENILKTDKLAEKKSGIINKVLGRDIRTEINIDDPETRKIVDTMQQATLAHEVYHLRQINLLWEKVHGPRKYTVSRSDPHEDIINQYKYRPEERGARAFVIRYLSEKAKRSPKGELDEKTINKYKDYLIGEEKAITTKYNEEVSEVL